MATVPIYMVLRRPVLESNSIPISTEGGALITSQCNWFQPTLVKAFFVTEKEKMTANVLSDPGKGLQPLS